jgi:peptide/nickel transport system ATP-binding protein
MAGSGTAHLRESDTVLRVEHLVMEYPGRRGQTVHAVSDLSFDLDVGETLGIVGESGCGKTTVGEAVMQLEVPTSGSVVLDGRELTQLSGAELRRARRGMQMIFQDPVSSLNPRRRVRDLVRESLDIWREDHIANSEALVVEALTAVGLDPTASADRRPHEFSGGQCQRICIARALVIARALAAEPSVLILDEPVSALDVSVQAQILNLLEDLKDRYGLSMMFISHDLAVIRNISDRIMVMYLGKTCEVAGSTTLYEQPAHPYTRALLASIPRHGLDLPPAPDLISGEPPSPLDPPSGCRFRTRCPRATEQCAAEEPELRRIGDDHFVACHDPHLPLGMVTSPQVKASPFQPRESTEP